MTSSDHSRLIPLSLLAAIAFTQPALDARAQGLTTPLHVGNVAAIENEFGDILTGSAGQPGALVMLLWASNNVIHPPGIDGSPHADNPALANGATAIGKSIAPGIENSGRFSISLSEPRPASGKIFVRAFNRAALAESSFYADSEIFTIAGNKEFLANIGATTNALDTADNDSDGLNNSWEKSYGADPENPDSDGDEISDGDEPGLGAHPAKADTDGDRTTDGHELRAGTDLTDPASYLGLDAAAPASPHLVIRWLSVPGRNYMLEAADDLPGPAFSNVSAVIPAEPGDETTATLTNALLDATRRIFRVRLVEE